MWFALRLRAELVERVVQWLLWWDPEQGRLLISNQFEDNLDIWEAFHDACIAALANQPYTRRQWLTAGAYCGSLRVCRLMGLASVVQSKCDSRGGDLHHLNGHQKLS